MAAALTPHLSRLSRYFPLSCPILHLPKPHVLTFRRRPSQRFLFFCCQFSRGFSVSAAEGSRGTGTVIVTYACLFSLCDEFIKHVYGNVDDYVFFIWLLRKVGMRKKRMNNFWILSFLVVWCLIIEKQLISVKPMRIVGVRFNVFYIVLRGKQSEWYVGLGEYIKMK